MIDIHAHIIPGLDDGSEDMGTSIIMAQMAEECGVSAIIATPHCNQVGRFENYMSDRLRRHIDELRNEVAKENIDVDIGIGMEVYCTREVPRLLTEKKLITLNNSRYLLVEFGFSMSAARMEEMLYPIMDGGYVPIIAHPERYMAIQDLPEIIDEWMDNGIGIQINKGSVFGRFGRSAYECSHFMLENGLVSCIASDAHGVERRTTDMTEIYDFIASEYSENEADILLTENPRRVFDDEPLVSVRDIQLF